MFVRSKFIIISSIILNFRAKAVLLMEGKVRWYPHIGSYLTLSYSNPLLSPSPSAKPRTSMIRASTRTRT